MSKHNYRNWYLWGYVEFKDDIREWTDITYGDMELLNRLKGSLFCPYSLRLYGQKWNFKSFLQLFPKWICWANSSLQWIQFVKWMVKTRIKPSQSANKPLNDAWNRAKKDGTVLTGGCSCMTGQGKSCSLINETKKMPYIMMVKDLSSELKANYLCFRAIL